MPTPFRPTLTPLDDRLLPAVDLTPTVSYALKNDWGSGYQAELALVNDQGASVRDWRLSFDFGRTVGSVWNAAVVERSGTRITLGPADYNRTLADGAAVRIGFTGSGGTAATRPANYQLSWADPDAPPPPTSGSVMARASIAVESRWATGYTASVSVTNTGATPVRDWRLAFDVGGRIVGTWNGAVIEQGGGRATVRNAGYNADIAPGQTMRFGFQAEGAPVPLTNVTLNGAPLGTPAPANPPSVSVGDASVVAPRAGVVSGTALSTRGNQIVDATGAPVRLTGVNWFGLETPNFAPHGLWARGYREMMDQMKATGFNTIRLPFSQQLLDANSRPNGVDFSKNPDLVGLTGLQVMDKVVDYAGQIGLRIVLDHHRSDAGSGANGGGLWYTASRPESAWVQTWRTLAARYANSPAVVGADLHNEPHGPATWGDGSATDWRLAAERAGNAILGVNPNWLIVVEGVERGPSGNYWWGGNLSAAGQFPVRLNVPGRLVYSPHDYPASVYPQGYFSAANYPNNLPAVWDANWGYLYKQGVAPVLLGEFGTKLETASDRAWFNAMANYLGAAAPAGRPQGPSWTYWSWNPNSGDTGGILADDWRTVQSAKVSVLAPMQFGILGSPSGPATATLLFTVRLSAASDSPATVRYATADGTAAAGSDYVAASGTLLFAPGETEKTVAVTVLANAAGEAEESLTLRLTDPSGATLGDALGAGVIR